MMKTIPETEHLIIAKAADLLQRCFMLCVGDHKLLFIHYLLISFTIYQVP